MLEFYGEFGFFGFFNVFLDFFSPQVLLYQETDDNKCRVSVGLDGKEW